MYQRRNQIIPFENETSLEFFSSKSDASLFAFASHTKKVPTYPPRERTILMTMMHTSISTPVVVAASALRSSHALSLSLSLSLAVRVVCV